jgi:hypothetical protein
MEVALITMAVAAAAGTTYQIASGEEAKKDAKNQRKDQLNKAKEAQDKVEADEKARNEFALRSATRQKQKAQGAFGRSDTMGTLGGSQSTILGGGVSNGA